MEADPIVAAVLVARPLSVVWSAWVDEAFIRSMNLSSDDWALLDLRFDVVTGGDFLVGFERSSGSEKFCWSGIFDQVVPGQMLRFTLSNGQTGSVEFQAIDENTIIRVSVETGADALVKKEFAQRLLDSFSTYVKLL
jgi:uncharacterized protein YndB with AHSA1/START domain